jgi:hypothetical protein
MASHPLPRGAGVAERRRNQSQLPRRQPRRSCTRIEPTVANRSCVPPAPGVLQTALRRRRAPMVGLAAAGPQRWVRPLVASDRRAPRRSPLGPRRLLPQRFLRLLTGRSLTSYPGTVPRQSSPLSGQAAVPPTPSRSMPRRLIPNPSSFRQPAPPRSEHRPAGFRRLDLNRLHPNRLHLNRPGLNRLGLNPPVLS